MHPDHDYLYAIRRIELDQQHQAAQRRRDHPPPRDLDRPGRTRHALAEQLRRIADRLAPSPGPASPA